MWSVNLIMYVGSQINGAMPKSKYFYYPTEKINYFSFKDAYKRVRMFGKANDAVGVVVWLL